MTSSLSRYVEIGSSKSIIHQTSGTVRVANTSDLSDSIHGAVSRGAGLLPPVIRAFSSDFTRVLIERPPQRVTIKYKAKQSEAEFNTEIQLPWQIYFIYASGWGVPHVNVFARPSEIFSTDDKLFKMPIPNQYSISNNMCLASNDLDQLSNLLAKERFVTPMFNDILDIMWHGRFNDDLNVHWQETVPKSWYEAGVDEGLEHSSWLRSPGWPELVMSRWAQSDLGDFGTTDEDCIFRSISAYEILDTMVGAIYGEGRNKWSEYKSALDTCDNSGDGTLTVGHLIDYVIDAHPESIMSEDTSSLGFFSKHFAKIGAIDEMMEHKEQDEDEEPF